MRSMFKPQLAKALLAATCLSLVSACGTSETQTAKEEITMTSNTEKAVALIESLESGDQAPVAFINADKYIPAQSECC